MLIEAGKLIHTASLYREEHTKNFAGTGKVELVFVKQLKCSVKDVTYQNKYSNNKEINEKTLKMTTRYFNDYDTNLLVKINADEQIYKIVYIENVDFENKILIFNLVGT